MGTGKTNAEAKRIKLRFKTKDHRVVILSFRISLTDQLIHDKFKDDPLMKSYRDGVSSPHSVQQPESLHKFRLPRDDREYYIDEVFIDEVGQVMKQFTGDTFIKQPKATKSYKVFEDIIKNAKHVHVADAHLTAEHIKWIQNIRGISGETCEIYWNTRKNLKGREIKITPTETDIIRLAQADLLDNKKVFIANNGNTEKIQAIADILKATKNSTLRGDPPAPDKKILAISSDTLSHENVIAALKNPNDPINGWATYDAIICSPSVQSGISYDTSDPNLQFDTVYGMFNNFTSMSSDAAQMLNRVRHPKNNITYVSIAMTNRNIGSHEINVLRNQIKYSQDHLYVAIREELEKCTNYNINYGFTEFKLTEYFKLFLQNTTTRNKDLKFFIWNFIRAHYIEGYIISEFDPLAHFNLTSEANDGYTVMCRGSVKLQKEANSAKKSVDISEAKSLTEDDADIISNMLKAGDSPSEAQMDSLKKYNISKTYNVPQIQTPEWFETYKKPKVRKHFKNQNRILRHDNFADALTDIKNSEIAYVRNNVKKLFVNNVSQEDAIQQGTVDMLKVKTQYEQFKFIFDIMTVLNITSLDPNKAVPITEINLKQKLKDVQDMITRESARMINKLKKKKEKVKQISEWKLTDNLYIKNMLLFVNGSLRKEFGISIGKVSRHENTYILKNNYLTKNIFNYVRNEDNEATNNSLHGNEPRNELCSLPSLLSQQNIPKVGVLYEGNESSLHDILIDLEPVPDKIDIKPDEAISDRMNLFNTSLEEETNQWSYLFDS
jgi:hypothetical protein